MNKRQQAERRAIKRAAANILAVYLDADEATRDAGRHWYRLERERCHDLAERKNATRVPAGKAPLSALAVAGAAAAISPGLKWEFTFAHIEALLENPKAKVPTYSRANVAKALHCLRGDNPAKVLGGPKVRAFYGLLSGTDPDAVVIDGHAWNIARGEYAVFRDREGYRAPAAARVTDKRYRIAAQAFREVAETVGETPHSVQAATWIHWRNITQRKGSK